MDISTLVNYLNDFANVIPWDAILASGILSPLMVPVIKFVKAERDITKLLLVFLGGTGIAIGHYLLTTPTDNPSIVLMQGAVLTFMAQPFWHLLVKPGIAYVKSEVARAIADQEKKSAVLPPALAESTPFAE